ncbi:DUF5655 domain-containing protein [Pedobacter sp. GR22-6]|uniref:DUF5655 domain-containing protein n=1 Tax=Pedobacter sp. GR22-6 TaxID=3127957 RepID=UPI00307DBE8B
MLKSNRLDTLAFDPEANAFVIIEYKRDRNYSVIDQGVSYLNLMLEYKADFIVEYNESQNNVLKRTDVDWSQSKVVFVAPSFTDFQRQSSNFKDLSIELWEIKRFDNDVVVLNPIKKSKSAPSIKPLQKVDSQSEISKVTKEIKVYQEEDLTTRGSEFSVELYEEFKHAILNLDNDLEFIPKKEYISFKRGKSNIADITILKKGIKMWINRKKGQLEDPKHIARNVAAVGHWGNGDYEILIEDNKNLEYIMSLVRQCI